MAGCGSTRQSEEAAFETSRPWPSRRRRSPPEVHASSQSGRASQPSGGPRAPASRRNERRQSGAGVPPPWTYLRRAPPPPAPRSLPSRLHRATRPRSSPPRTSRRAPRRRRRPARRAPQCAAGRKQQHLSPASRTHRLCWRLQAGCCSTIAERCGQGDRLSALAHTPHR
eukprot:scaffold544_cov117-Isochrysis_galbana.AAC.15